MSNKEADTVALEQLNVLVAKVKQAQTLFATYTQEQVDEIFRAAALAAADARIPLAKMAAEESGMGVVEDKVSEMSCLYVYAVVAKRALTISRSPIRSSKIISHPNTSTINTRTTRLVACWRWMRSSEL